MPGEPGPGGSGEHARRPQRLCHPLGVTAAPPRPLRAAGFGLQVCLDLSGGRRPEFGDGGDDLLGQLTVALDDLRAPATVGVLPHPPAQQRPVVDRQQRRLVRPIFDEMARRPRIMAPRQRIEGVPIVGAEPAERRRVVRPHADRYRIQLQHLYSGQQTLQVCPGYRPGRLGFVKALGGDGDATGLGGGECCHCHIVAQTTDKLAHGSARLSAEPPTIPAAHPVLGLRSLPAGPDGKDQQ